MHLPTKTSIVKKRKEIVSFHFLIRTKGCRQIQKKLSKVGFSMECFAADFLWLASESFKNWLCGSHQGARLQIQAFQGFP